MRLIFEEDIEKMDFLEIILSQKEYEKIPIKGAVENFCGGLHGNDKRTLNVYVRIDPNLEQE